MLLYITSSGACTVCSGVPQFLLLWWSDTLDLNANSIGDDEAKAISPSWSIMD